MATFFIVVASEANSLFTEPSLISLTYARVLVIGFADRISNKIESSTSFASTLFLINSSSIGISSL